MLGNNYLCEFFLTNARFLLYQRLFLLFHFTFKIFKRIVTETDVKKVKIILMMFIFLKARTNQSNFLFLFSIKKYKNVYLGIEQVHNEVVVKIKRFSFFICLCVKHKKSLLCNITFTNKQ